MPEQVTDAKDFETTADRVLDGLEKETPAGSSPENKPENESTPTDKTATAEVDKTEKVKEVEADTSLSVENKIAKIKEILGEDEKAIEAYIKQKGYHNDPAWQKQRELIEKLKKEGKASVLSEEDKKALDEFKQLRSSPEYIQQNMKAQGFTQDAIDKKLKELGHSVPETVQDDVELVVEKLGVNLKGMRPEEAETVKANISDIVKISRIIFNDGIGKTLPKELGPIQEHISSMSKEKSARKQVDAMQEIVKAEGVLDFEKDIEPELNKFIDANPDAIQQDVFEHFKTINHSLSVERLRTGKKKEERDEKRTNLRQNISISGNTPFPKKTGNFDDDADAILDALNA